MISKEQFVKLADAYMRQDKYESELESAIFKVARDNEHPVDFLGLPYQSHLVSKAVLDVLGDDFGYYYFYCGGSFKQFNKNIQFKDTSHPDVKNLDDLYDFAVKEGSIK